MPIRAVIFDIGGVLLRRVDWTGERAWEKRLGVDKGGLYRLLTRTGLERSATLGLVSERQLFQRFAANLGLDEEQLRQFEEAIWSGYQFNTELAEFLQSLRPRYKTATLSNAWSEAREAVSREHKLNEFVDVMFFSAEVGLAKPDSRFYQLALSYLQVYPEEVVFLDDVAENIDTARLLGIHGIRYKDNAQAIAAVRKYLDV